MNGKDIFLGLQYIDQSYLEELEQEEFPRSAGGKRFRKPLLIAAIITLMLFLMGCAVVALNLQDLKIGEVTRTQYEHDAEGNPVSKQEVTLDVISVQGVSGSANFLAAQEWLEFEENYALNMAEAEDFVIPAGYEVYNACSQEMVDKVDEICRKYGLKTVGTPVYMQPYQFDVLCKALNMDSLLHDGMNVENGVGYFTECGNFNVMFSFTLTSGEAEWTKPIGVTMRYADKEYFDTISLSVGDTDTVKQRNYTCKDGTVVLIAGEGSDAKILCDREDAFISLYFDPDTLSGENVVLSERDLELIAEAVDFSVKPQKPNMEEVDNLLDAAKTAYQMDHYADLPKTWEEVLASVDQNLYYMLTDLNADGENEILIGENTESFGQIYTKIGGSYILYTMIWEDPAEPISGYPMLGQCKSAMYLCEDGIFEVCKVYENGDMVYSYSRLEKDAEKNGITNVAFIRYDAEADTWHDRALLVTSYDEATGEYEAYDYNDEITEEAASAVMESYPRIDLEMKPVADFAME